MIETSFYRELKKLCSGISKIRTLEDLKEHYIEKSHYLSQNPLSEKDLVSLLLHYGGLIEKQGGDLVIMKGLLNEIQEINQRKDSVDFFNKGAERVENYSRKYKKIMEGEKLPSDNRFFPVDPHHVTKALTLLSFVNGISFIFLTQENHITPVLFLPNGNKNRKIVENGLDKLIGY